MGPGEVEWSGPSPRLRSLRHVQVGATAGVTVLLGVLVATGAPVAGAVIVGVAVLGGLGADVLAMRRVRAWGYAERDEDLLVRRGVLFRRVSVVPYGRMQFVDVTAGPAERSFGLATVRMHTAAAASDARIPGLAAAEAARVRDRLAALGEHQATGL